MVVHTPARPPLLRWPINTACPTAEKLYDALNIPPGFRVEAVFGSVRISHTDHRIDDELHALAEQLCEELGKHTRVEVFAGAIVVSGAPQVPHRWSAWSGHCSGSSRSGEPSWDAGSTPPARW